MSKKNKVKKALDKANEYAYMAEVLAPLANKAVPVAIETAKVIYNGVKNARDQFKKYIKVSKVQLGEFTGAPIEMFGDDMAYIRLKEDGSEVLMLTSDNIESYHFVSEEKRQVGLARHTYRYYAITFKDGSKSEVIMRDKYAEAMEKHSEGDGDLIKS